MTWKMTLCADGRSDLIRETFTDWDAVTAWLRENHPKLLDPKRWQSLDNDHWRQFGTNYYWASFERCP